MPVNWATGLVHPAGVGVGPAAGEIVMDDVHGIDATAVWLWVATVKLPFVVSIKLPDWKLAPVHRLRAVFRDWPTVPGTVHVGGGGGGGGDGSAVTTV